VCGFNRLKGQRVRGRRGRRKGEEFFFAFGSWDDSANRAQGSGWPVGFGLSPFRAIGLRSCMTSLADTLP